MKKSPPSAPPSAKDSPKIMAKAIAKDIAIVPMTDISGAEGPELSPPAISEATAPSGLTRPSKTRTKTKAAKAQSLVSTRQVWAMQSRKLPLHTQIERLNQQRTQSHVQEPLQSSTLVSPPMPTPQSSGVLAPPPLDPWEPLPVEDKPASSVPVTPQEAQTSQEISNALRALAGRQSLTTAPPHSSGSQPARQPIRQPVTPLPHPSATHPASVPQPTIAAPRPRTRRRVHPIKAKVRQLIHWLAHQLRVALQSPRTVSDYAWNGAVWFGLAIALRGISKLLLATLPGFGAVMGIGVVLGTVTIIYLALQPKCETVVLYRLLFILLGFWLGGRL